MTVLELSALGAWARLNLPLAREGGAVRVVRGDSPVAEVERELDSIILAQMPAAIVALADRVKALEAALGYIAGFTPGHAPNDSAAYVKGLADAARVYKKLANEALKEAGNE